MDMHSDNHNKGGAGRWVFWGFALVAGYFLLTEHRAHLFGVLPYLLVLACPLMHLFHRHGGHGHGGHGGHAGHAGHDQRHHADSGAAANDAAAKPRDQ